MVLKVVSGERECSLGNETATKADACNEQGQVWDWEMDQIPAMQVKLTLEGGGMLLLRGVRAW